MCPQSSPAGTSIIDIGYELELNWPDTCLLSQPVNLSIDKINNKKTLLHPLFRVWCGGITKQIKPSVCCVALSYLLLLPSIWRLQKVKGGAESLFKSSIISEIWWLDRALGYQSDGWRNSSCIKSEDYWSGRNRCR